MTAGNQVLLPFGRLGWNKVQHSLIELHVTSDVMEIKWLLESDELLPFGTNAAPVRAIHQIQLMAASSFSPLRIHIACERT
jgi:hypothetical protein